MNYWEMLEAISPYDYSIKNKIVNHTELCEDEENEQFHAPRAEGLIPSPKCVNR